ncbi:M48 metallopeptidase family protein [Ornithinimicrobium sediminis]|uniref:M48 metallopeptidase family protein n=1 Tax=Ornithinimicrobium sediminis TaxID=2904603 RepID=UPI001E377EFD|nr:M48 family metallopeptidase [Ornithinimicrobium sediminis]
MSEQSGIDGGPTVPERIEIRRSARRRRTVSARVEADRVVVLMPSGLTPAEEERHVEELVARLQRSRRRLRLATQDLLGRARGLSETYLEGRADPVSVRWVTNQGRRWGSCSVGSRTIRLSDALEQMPSWVVDAVLVHELAHLLVPDHSAAFHAWVSRYPRYAEAQAFLSGAAWARGGATAAEGPDGRD